MPPWFSALREAGLPALAPLMAATHLNHITLVQERGAAWVIKRRRWPAPLLILLGNRVTRRRRPVVIALQSRAWRAWEARLHPLVNGLAVTTAPRGGIRILLAPGEPLQAILASPSCTLAEKLMAFGAATRALRELHAIRLEDREVPLSHGDATARNVVYDCQTGRAAWFDFEMVHDLAAAAALRQADDLRALYFSAAPHLAPAHLPRFAEALLQAHGGAPALAELHRLIATARLDWDLYHLAQTLAPSSQRRAAHEALLAALEGSNAVAL